MSQDDDTLDEPIGSPPLRPVVALYRAISTMQARCDQLQRAIAAPDSSGVERTATDAAYWWLVARATLSRLTSLDGDQALYAESAGRSVASASGMLSRLLRLAGRKIKSSQVRRTLAQLRLSLAIAADGLSAPPPDERCAQAPDLRRISDARET
jgi:hypothetical protein